MSAREERVRKTLPGEEDDEDDSAHDLKCMAPACGAYQPLNGRRCDCPTKSQTEEGIAHGAAATFVEPVSDQT
jgi:hypothetical protein